MRAAVTVQVGWCMGHRLPNHDGKCSRLHGHQYTAEATVDGMISTTEGAADEGMVLDFTVIKDALREIVGDLDHQMLIFWRDPLLEQGLQYMPGVKLFEAVPTAENIGVYILEKLPDSVIKLRIWETPTSYADVYRATGSF